MAGNFSAALETAEHALSAAPDEVWLSANRAHALMFLGRVDEARALYLRYRGNKVKNDGTLWESIILNDFAVLRKAERADPLMNEIEERFASR